MTEQTKSQEKMGRERDGKREKEYRDDKEEITEHKGKRSGEDKNLKGKIEDEESEDDTESSSESEEEDRKHRSRRKRSRSKRRSGSRSRSRRRYSDEDSDSYSGSDSSEESDESSEYSDSDTGAEASESGEERRRKRKERRKKEEKREKERKRRKEKERRKRKRDEADEKRRRKKDKEKRKEEKKRKKERGKTGAVTNSWGKYGVLRESDMWTKRPEFTAWLAEVKKVNLESLPNWEEKKMFKEYMEDYNTATMPSKKYYNIDTYHKRKMMRQMKKGFKKLPEAERTVFNDEEQRRLELMKEREKQKEQQVEALKEAMKSGMAQDMKDQARLREEMAYQYKLGNFEAAAAIQRKLDPDVAM